MISPDVAKIPEQSQAILDKHVSDMVSEDTYIDKNGYVHGTLKYISGFSQFSNVPEEQNGNYFPVNLGEKYKDKQIICKGKNTKTETDTEWVLLVENQDSKFTFSTEEDEIILELSFKNAEFNQKSMPEMGKVMAKRSKAISKKSTDESNN